MRRLAWIFALLCWSSTACESEITVRGEMEAMRPPDGGKARPTKTQKPIVPPLPPVALEPDGGFAPVPTEKNPNALPETPPKSGMVLPKWDMPDKTGRAYGVWVEPILPSKDPLKGLSTNSILGQSALGPSIIKRLKKMRLPTKPTYTVVLTPSYNKRILSRWILNGVANPNALPPKVGYIVEQKTGQVMINAEFDPLGKIYTMLSRGLHNLLVATFALPGHWIEVGDDWPLDMKLKIPSGFDHEKPEILAQARLVSLRKQKGERLARIEMRVAHRLKGTYLPGSSNPEILSMDFVFVGIGEFSLDQGGWKEFFGYIHEHNQGAIELDDRRLFKISPMKTIPTHAKILLKLD